MSVLFVYQTDMQDSGHDRCLSSSRIQLHMSLIDTREELDCKSGLLVSATSGCRYSSEKMINNKQERNRSQMKRVVNRTDDVKVRKVSKLTSIGDGHCQRSVKTSTTAAEDEVKNVVIKMANKNTTNWKSSKAEKTASVLSDDATHQNKVPITTPTKKKTVNNSTRKCAESLRTVKKVSGVQCKRKTTQHERPSLRSSFSVSVKPSRKTTDHLAGGDTAGKPAGSVMDQTLTETEDSPSCVNIGTALKPHGTKNYHKASIASHDVSSAMGSSCTKVVVPRCTDGMRKRQKAEKAPPPAFHMTLRPRHQHTVMAANESQTASVTVSMKRHRLVKSEDKRYRSKKPCWNGDQKLHRCSMNWHYCYSHF